MKTIYCKHLSLLLLVVMFLFSCNNDSGTSPSSNDDVVSINTASIEQKENQIIVQALVTDSKGNPLPAKRVDFDIIEGEGELNVHSTITNSSGYANAVVNNPKQGTIKIKASVFGYNSSITFIVNVPSQSISDSVSIIVSSLQCSSSRCDIYYIVSDLKGNPLPNKRVDFEIVEGDGSLRYQSTLTSGSGSANTYIDKKTTKIVKIKATVFGYDASVLQEIQFN